MKIDDYQIIKVLGKGCMGKVLLVKHRRTSHLYAIKSISKSTVLVNNELKHTLTERAILTKVSQIKHPFLIQCHHSFTSDSKLFLVLDFVSGGDMATQLAKDGKFPNQRVLFYAAEILLGLLELHKLQIVYRDLKPENILIQKDGHIVLTDFGLSKFIYEQQTRTFAGTAEYLAPEILRDQEYSFAVDYWSFGTLVFEMLVGVTPFWADNQAKMYQRVLEDKLEFPDQMSLDAKNLLTQLLDRNPRTRLGSGPKHLILQHPYFNSIDWDLVFHRKLKPPFVPKVSSALDLSNFEDIFTSMNPQLSPPTGHLTQQLQEHFQGYSWKSTAPIHQYKPSPLRQMMDSESDDDYFCKF